MSLYFAYGSNINLTQMASRCPDAEPVGRATLPGYRLAFRSGSGVATIIPAQGRKVEGLLWKLTDECEKSLDRYEGFPHFYYKDRVTVTDPHDQKHVVMAYIMAREFEREPNMPSRGYYFGILEGYKQNGIPLDCLKTALYECQNEVRRFAEAERKRQLRFGWEDFRLKNKPPER